MNKITLAVAMLATLTSVALAQTTGSRPPMTPEQLARLRAARTRQTGGFLHIEGQGFLGVLNAQKVVSDEVIAAQAQALGKSARDVAVKVLPAAFSIATARAELAKCGAGAVVFIIDDASLPISLIAMEEGWGYVNVAKLRGEGLDEKKFEARFRKEFVRVSSVIFTGPQSQYKTSPLQTVRSAADLDKVVGETYGMDTTMAIMNNFTKMGVKPGRMVSYRRACQEGIAPMPTNDVQKAIWEQVKAEADAKPSNPMKITKEKK